MIATYQAGDNTSTTGKQLSSTVQNIELFKIVIGAPVTGGNILIFSDNNPGNSSATTGLVMKLTQGTVSESTQKVYDLTNEDGNGLTLSGGGAIFIDQTMQVTFLWDYVSAEGGKA